MVNRNDEKLEFSIRLKKALKRSPKKVETPSELALQFNLRSPTDQITTAAAQKWLSGKARPTPDKIATLAVWLNVSPQWLRYGIPESRSTQPTGKKSLPQKVDPTLQPTLEEMVVLANLRLLSEYQRRIINDTIEQFGLNHEIWNG